jgi:GH18 family chitinase
VLKKKSKLLTAALSRGYGGSKVPNETLKLFDFVNIMAYDGTGPWDPKTPGQHSSMEYARQNVKYWLDRGLPKENAVLGVPFYGYGFGKDFRKDEYAFKDIVAKFPGSENADQAGETVWYNGLPTMRAKTEYVLKNQLGGVMIWELSSDAAGEKSLLEVIHATIVEGAATQKAK